MQERLQTSTRARIHAIIQLNTFPDDSEIALLEEAGVELLTYIPDRAWLASIPADITAIQAILPQVRWCGDISRNDKISPGIRIRGTGSWAIRGLKLVGTAPNSRVATRRARK